MHLSQELHRRYLNQSYNATMFSSIQTAINGCALRDGATPCQNGGTCVDSVGTYYCHCAEGYAGTSCAEDGELHI